MDEDGKTSLVSTTITTTTTPTTEPDNSTAGESAFTTTPTSTPTKGFRDLPTEIHDKIFIEVITFYHEQLGGPHRASGNDAITPGCGAFPHPFASSLPFYLLISAIADLQLGFGNSIDRHSLLDTYCIANQLTAFFNLGPKDHSSFQFPFDLENFEWRVRFGTFEPLPDLQKYVRSLKVGWPACHGQVGRADEMLLDTLRMIVEGCSKLTVLTVVESKEYIERRGAQREWITSMVKDVEKCEGRSIRVESTSMRWDLANKVWIESISETE